MKRHQHLSPTTNERGLSLIESMVALVVVSVMGLALTNLMVATGRQTKKAALQIDGVALANEITALLSNPANCRLNFLNKPYQSLPESSLLTLKAKTLDIPPAEIDVLKVYNPALSDAEKAKLRIGTTKFKILGMSLDQSEGAGIADNASQQVTYLVIRFEMDKLTSAEKDVDSNRELKQKIKLSYLPIGPNISSCRSVGGLTDTWNRPLSGTVNDLFYDGGLVGIGTNNPLNLFHVNSAPSGGAGTAHIRLTNSSSGNISFLASDANGFARLAGNAGVGFGYTDGTGFTEVIRASNTGRVGIGTDNPSQAFEIRAPAASTTGYIYNNKPDGGLLFGTDDVQSRGGIGLANAAGNWSVDSAGGDLVMRVLKGGNLDFSTSTGAAAQTSTKMRILSNGNLGVGTNNPTWPIHVQRNDPGGNVRTAIVNSGAGASTSADLVVSTGTANSYTGLLQFDGATPYTQIIGGPANSGGFFLDQQANGPMIFRVNASAERMRIAANGFVGIGTTNPQVPLDVNGGMKIGYFGSNCDSAREGSVRYVATTKSMEVCNGTSWGPAVKPEDMCVATGGKWNVSTGKCEAPSEAESCALSMADVPGGITHSSMKCRKAMAEKLKVEDIPVGERSNYIWFCNSVWTGSGYRDYDATKVTTANNCVTAGRLVVADAGTPIPPGFTCGGEPTATAINQKCGYFSCLSGALIYQPPCPGGEIGGGGGEGGEVTGGGGGEVGEGTGGLY